MTQLVAETLKVALVGAGSLGSALLAHLEGAVQDGASLSIAAWDVDQGGSDAVAVREADCWILAVESGATCDILEALAAERRSPVRILNAGKALDPGSGRRSSVLAAEALGDRLEGYAVLAGAIRAEGLRRGSRLHATIASRSRDADRWARALFRPQYIDLEFSADLIGVEFASAFGTVLALAAGIAKGAGVGACAQARLMTSLLCELADLAISLGADTDTFSLRSRVWTAEVCLSGTAATPSREFGVLLGRGFSVDEALAASSHWDSGIEGYQTACALGRLMDARPPGKLCGVFELVVGARTLVETLDGWFGGAR